MIKGQADHEQKIFRSFILFQLGEKVQDKKQRVYEDFIGLLKKYDRVNKKELWYVLRM